MRYDIDPTTRMPILPKGYAFRVAEDWIGGYVLKLIEPILTLGGKPIFWIKRYEVWIYHVESFSIRDVKNTEELTDAQIVYAARRLMEKVPEGALSAEQRQKASRNNHTKLGNYPPKTIGKELK